MPWQSSFTARLLRSRCLICDNKLSDALSVEIGIGPVCRSRTDYDRTARNLQEDERREANAIIHEIVEGTGDPLLGERVARLRALGFTILAARLLEAIVTVRIERVTSADQTWLVVQTPYNASALPAWRSIPGRVWDPTAKANRIPIEQEQQLRNLLAEHYGGLIAQDANSIFRVPSTDVPFALALAQQPSEPRSPELRMLVQLRRGETDDVKEE